MSRYKAVVIGVSAGGLEALSVVLPMLDPRMKQPVIVLQHLYPSREDCLVECLEKLCPLMVEEAEQKEPVMPGHLYVAPADYHLLVERDATFSLSVDARVNYSRPSIDVLFESAADVWGPVLVGIILTGASSDGARGITAVKKRGGLTIAQDPAGAASAVMPQAAIDTGHVDRILSLDEIGGFFKTCLA